MLSKAAADGLLALADKGCTGEGIGTSNPIEGDNPCPDNIAYNTIQAGLHASSEGAKAPLKSFKALRKVSLTSSIIVTVVLVIFNLDNQP